MFGCIPVNSLSKAEVASASVVPMTAPFCMKLTTAPGDARPDNSKLPVWAGMLIEIVTLEVIGVLVLANTGEAEMYMRTASMAIAAPPLCGVTMSP